ncbi:hypothetical protein [Pararhizobium antarcticum]|uniref:DUF883 domain-containing protein n=1 Tax=Pararhizobium antarcticum TaxID=1798805 RepID=A0A657LUG8_9HYPH|nr:hypothetical protein [Pararhizobium antarcticum]OJF94978.1 hypothetical protein AX760_03870 [Pararhizobium antarcticum]OJF97480.1 hypothetical protein AX761_14770 [Rhizobium sp. 58]
MAELINPDIKALREEVARLTKIVSAQGTKAYTDVRERAADAYDAAAPQARKAVAQVRAEGSAIAGVAREHPAAAGSVVFLAAAAGMLVGYLLGSQSEPERSPYWWR